jgi:uncharacterized protein
VDGAAEASFPRLNLVIDSSDAACNLTTVSRVRELLHENREDIDALVRKHRGIAVSVFGSVARGDETERSDIDFLVQFESGSSLFDLLHLEDDLRALLGRSVDVVSAGGLKDRDEQIRREAVSI